MFVDQRWMDLAPGLVDSVRIVRDPGYDVAYWNLKHRALSGPPEAPLANGSPVRFYHWSGFDPTKPTALSKHQNRYPEDRDRAARWPWRASTARSSCRRAIAPAPPGPTRSGSSRTATRSRRRCATSSARTRSGASRIRSSPPATTRSSAGRSRRRPRAGRRRCSRRSTRSFARIDRSPRWKRTLPGRVLRKIAVKTLVPLREALRRRAPLAPLANRVLERRADVQQAFARPGGGVDRLEFVRWLSHDGIVHHRLKPAWAAAWLAEVEDVGVMRSLLDFYDGDAELQAALPAGLRGGARRGVPSSPGWRRTRSRAASRRRRSPRCGGCSRRGRRERDPVDLRAAGPDVQAAYPDALAWPPAPGFVAWLHLLRPRGARPVGGQRALVRARGAPARVPARGRGLARARGMAGAAPAGRDRVRTRRLPRLAARGARGPRPGGSRASVRARRAASRRRAAALPPRGRRGARARIPRVRGSGRHGRPARRRARARGGARPLRRLDRGGAPRAAADGAARGRDDRRATCARSRAWASCPARPRAR